MFAPTPQKVTVAFISGAGVEVRLHEGTMAVTVLLPLDFTNGTKGLLGWLNSDPSSDLVTAQGQAFSPANATSEEIFIFGAGCECKGLLPSVSQSDVLLLHARN